MASSSQSRKSRHPDGPPRTLDSFLKILAGPTVKITVGIPQRGLPPPTYTVHQELLEANSTILQGLRPQSSSWRDRIKTLHKHRTEFGCVDPTIFELFLHFIYRSEYPRFTRTELDQQKDLTMWVIHNVVEDTVVLQSARAWVFGVRYQAIEFANHAMKHLYEGYRNTWGLNAKLLVWVWQNTDDKPDNRLRRFFYDVYLVHRTSAVLGSHLPPTHNFFSPLHRRYWSSVLAQFPVFATASSQAEKREIVHRLRDLDAYLIS